MTTPTPDAPPPDPGYNPFQRPRMSGMAATGLILLALLLIIPGLCFALAKDMGMLPVLLLVAWVGVLIAFLVWIVVAIVKAIAQSFKK